MSKIKEFKRFKCQSRLGVLKCCFLDCAILQYCCTMEMHLGNVLEHIECNGDKLSKHTVQFDRV